MADVPGTQRKRSEENRRSIDGQVLQQVGWTLQNQGCESSSKTRPGATWLVLSHAIWDDDSELTILKKGG